MRCFGRGRDLMTSAGSFDFGYLPWFLNLIVHPLGSTRLDGKLGPRARNVRAGVCEGRLLVRALQLAFVDL